MAAHIAESVGFTVVTVWADDFTVLDQDPDSWPIADHAGEKFSELIAQARTFKFPGNKIPKRFENVLVAMGMGDVTDPEPGNMLFKVLKRLEPAAFDGMYEVKRTPVKQTITTTFTGSNGTGITTHDSGWDVLTGTEPVLDGSGSLKPATTYEYLKCVRNESAFPDDHYVEVDAFINDSGDGDDFVGPAIRIQSGGTEYCYLLTNAGAGYVEIRKQTGAETFTYVSDASPSIVNDTYYNWRLEAVGTTLTLDIDGTEEISTTDSTYSSGKPGIFGYYNLTGWRIAEYRSTDAVASGPSVGALHHHYQHNQG